MSVQNNNEISKLLVNLKLKKWQTLTLIGTQNKLKMVIYRILTFRFALKIFKTMERGISKILWLKNVEKKNTEFKNRFLQANSLDSSNFGYTGDYWFEEIKFMKKYYDQIKGNNWQDSESKSVYDQILKNSRQVLSTHNKSLYINFGVGYAYTDAILATEYVNSSFIGLERTNAAESFNNNYLELSPKNLHFVASDVLDFLDNLTRHVDSLQINDTYDTKVFVTARTMCLLPEYLVRSIYQKVQQCGFRYIIGVEQYGIPRDTGEEYRFDYDGNKASKHWRSIISIHNYTGIIASLGYKFEKLDSISTNHPHPDFRLMSYVAKI